MPGTSQSQKNHIPVTDGEATLGTQIGVPCMGDAIQKEITNTKVSKLRVPTNCKHRHPRSRHDRLRSVERRTLRGLTLTLTAPRLGASAGLCSVGTYSKCNVVSVARHKAEMRQMIRRSVREELRPLATAPSTAFASTSKTTRCPS